MKKETMIWALERETKQAHEGDKQGIFKQKHRHMNNMASSETALILACLEHSVHGKCMEDGLEMGGHLSLRSGGKFQGLVKVCLNLKSLPGLRRSLYPMVLQISESGGS